LKRGSRLIEERLEAILNTVKEVLTNKEKELFIYILYNYKVVLA
jgi:hypothetical protein